MILVNKINHIEKLAILNRITVYVSVFTTLINNLFMNYTTIEKD